MPADLARCSKSFLFLSLNNSFSKPIYSRVRLRLEFQEKHFGNTYRIVASRSTCSENQIFHFLKSRILTCLIFFLGTKLFCLWSELAEIFSILLFWDFMNPHKISANSDHKQKIFIPKKICGMLVFETLKNKKSDFLNSNTC